MSLSKRIAPRHGFHLTGALLTLLLAGTILLLKWRHG